MVLTMKPNIATVDISKTYGKIQALSGLSFEVEPGGIYGLIGPNGAGKTTSLAILAGLIQPTSGTAWILGQQVRPGSRELASAIGFASPQFPLFDYLTGIEMLSACGLMHGLTALEVKKRVSDLLGLMDLEPASKEYICLYSQGMKQKIALACALIHAPEIVLLDEPFLGLDPTTIYRLVGLFRQMAAKGRTLVISSHNMTLVERLCSRVGILFKGALQREIAVAPPCDGSSAIITETKSVSMLESALWEVVGTPESKELAWI
jgi:ABC-2 type transport system ATP-binding protein